MKRFSQKELEALSTEDLLFLVNPDFSFGSTYFEEKSKKYVVMHNYHLVGEINDEEDDVDEWETFGYPMEVLAGCKTPSIYGDTPRNTLIKFLHTYPQLIVRELPEKQPIETTE